MRFLAPDQVHPAELGKPFPLFFVNEDVDPLPEFSEANQYPSLVYINHTGLLGGDHTRLLIDTADNVDGAVESDAMRGHYGTRFLHFLLPPYAMRFEKSTWDDQAYTNLRVGSGGDANVLGLRFLARHLVTFEI